MSDCDENVRFPYEDATNAMNGEDNEENENQAMSFDFAATETSLSTNGSPGRRQARSHINTSTVMATTTCLHRYAMDRIRAAEQDEALWPPLLHIIFHYLYTGINSANNKATSNEPYKRTNLLNERNFAMLELLLNVPIQLRIVYPSGSFIDLNDKGSFDPNGVSFVEAKDLLADLVAIGVVKPEQVRVFD